MIDFNNENEMETIEKIALFGCKHNTPAVANACIVLLGAIATEMDLESEEAETLCELMQDIAESLTSNMGHGHLSPDASRQLRNGFNLPLMDNQDKRDQKMLKIADKIYDEDADWNIRQVINDAWKDAGFSETERERMLMNYFG